MNIQKAVVGVVGLGKMGLPIARHIAANDHEVIGFDLSAEATQQATADGLKVAADLDGLLAECSVLFVAVDTESAVTSVVQAVHDRWPSGDVDDRLVVILATIKVSTTRQYAALAEDRFGLLDAPLCKGETAAEDGTLLVMAGGDRRRYEECLPLLRCFSSECYLLGPLGAGQVGKLVNNLVLWTSMSATSEGFWLAEQLGADLHVLREALLNSSGRTWVLETWYRPRDMPWATKDMTMILEEADAANLSLPMAGVVREVIKSVKARGRPGAVLPDAAEAS